MSMDASEHPLGGLWRPNPLERLYYGPKCVQQRLLSCLPSQDSKAFVVTGSSLKHRTSLIQEVEEILGARHAGTFSSISQHAPAAELDRAFEILSIDTSIDTVISVGGGSPIDSAKIISSYAESKTGKYLYHITIPTTLSAAECTMGGAYTKPDGTKAFVISPELTPKAILYDALYAQQTPARLWLATGLRALDHAIELLYHPTATEVPCKQICLQAASDLLIYLPKYKDNPKDVDVVTRLQLAAFASLGFIGLNFKPLGLSHSLGYALGSPYGIPHGETSCLTLGHVVKLKARTDPAAARSLSRLLPRIGQQQTGDDIADAETVGDLVLAFVKSLSLYRTLGEYGVDTDQVDIITKRATGKEKGDAFYDAVEPLVMHLF